MPNMTVPMMTPGAKSLPAELKVGGGNPFYRMRAESPGYGRRTLHGWENSGPTVWPVVAGNVVLNPVVASWAGLRGLRGLGQCDPSDPTCTDGTTDGSGGSGVDLGPGGTLCSDGTVMDASGICGGSDIIPSVPAGITASPAGWNGPTQVTAGVTPPTPPNGYAWAQVLNASGQSIGQILAIAQGGSVTTLPNGMKIVQGSTSGAVTQASTGIAGAVATVFNSPQTMVMLLGGVLVVMLVAGKGR